MEIKFHPIGIIHTPFKELQGMPIQPAGATGVKGTVSIYEKYREGLKDLEGFSHIILLYHFHRSQSYKLHVVPFLDSRERGLFATRAPRRPNPIGISTVRLMKIQDGIMHIENTDMLDGTPLLDIKPFVPDFNAPGEMRTGWLEDVRNNVKKKKADNRFR